MTKRIMALLVAAVVVTTAAAASLIDHGKPSEFLELDLHAMLGGTQITQNYSSAFPQISELDMSMGTAYGAGATAEMAFTNFLALGLQTNLLCNHYRINMAVANDEGPSMTNVFISNRYWTVNIPVYMTVRFRIGANVRWNVDGGIYYSYGLSGKSKSTLYNARVNELGQLITVVTNQRGDYYNSPDAFLNSSYRGDIGLHLATGFLFSNRIVLRLSTQIGFKNVAHVYNGVKRPNIHNHNFFCSVGWRF